jgi:hypothetical protein
MAKSITCKISYHVLLDLRLQFLGSSSGSPCVPYMSFINHWSAALFTHLPACTSTLTLSNLVSSFYGH